MSRARAAWPQRRQGGRKTRLTSYPAHGPAHRPNQRPERRPFRACSCLQVSSPILSPRLPLTRQIPLSGPALSLTLSSTITPSSALSPSFFSRRFAVGPFSAR